MRWIFTLLLFFGFIAGYGQNQGISGIVYSGSYLEPLNKVHVRMGKYSTKTDFEGKFNLRSTPGEPLILSHTSYHTQKVIFQEASAIENAKYYLTPSTAASSMVIEGDDVQKIYTPDFEHVFDYTFLGDTLIVISYMNLGKPETKFGEKPYINCTITAKFRGEMIERKVLPNNLQKLFHHPDGSVFLEGADTTYILNRNQNDLRLAGFSHTDYNEFVKLAYAKTDNAIFYAHSYPFIPQVAHRAYDLINHESHLLQMIQNHGYFDKVEDDFAMLTEAELKITKELEETTGINHRVFSTYVRSFEIIRDIATPYAPGFLVDDAILIFDHRNNKLYNFDTRGSRKSQKRMYHSALNKEELVKMVQDKSSGMIYTVHNKSGVIYVRKVDIETGATGRPFKLHYPFAENIKVFDSYVYYLHKTPVDVKYNHLIRQKLPFSNKSNAENTDEYYPD